VEGKPVRIPWSPLVLFWLAYGLVGWYLSAHDIVWYIAIFTAVVVMVVSLTTNPWLGGLLGYIPQILVIVLTISILVTLAVSFSSLSTLIFMPLFTSFLAWQELRSQNLRKKTVLWALVAIALVGLAVGEVVDLSILPNNHY
jgi:hypothetical protein